MPGLSFLLQDLGGSFSVFFKDMGESSKVLRLIGIALKV